MDTPKNCNECHFHDNCNSYYGGLGCKFNKVIRPLAITIGLVLGLLIAPAI